MTSMIYLDNNATTVMPVEVIKSLVSWLNKGNPSAGYKTANDCRDMMREFRTYIASKCGFISYEPDVKYTQQQMKQVYHITFTSGASESNNCLIRSVAAAYKFNKGVLAHIVTSSTEHKSIIDCVTQLVNMGLAEATFVKPTVLGFIEPDDVKKAIKSNTALVTIMHANNETGAINNIKAIGAIAHDKHVPFHTDAVQTFGKFMMNPIGFNVDAFSVSFHKLHGDKGTGLLVVKQQFKDGFRLMPQVCGSQNCGFRGGTENVSGIAAAYTATKLTWGNRTTKNEKMLALKKSIMSGLRAKIPTQLYREYLNEPSKYAISLVFISAATKIYLPNTLMISVIKRTEPPMCNIDLKNNLEKHGVLVSIGSACNTRNSKASHVLEQMNVDAFVRKGTIRVSLGDYTTQQNVDDFVNIFIVVLKKMIKK